LFCSVIHVSWRGFDLSLGIRIVNLHTKRIAKIVDGHLNWGDYEKPMMVWDVEYEDSGLTFRMNEHYELHWELLEEE
jgi:hypothetical protein